MIIIKMVYYYLIGEEKREMIKEVEENSGYVKNMEGFIIELDAEIEMIEGMEEMMRWMKMGKVKRTEKKRLNEYRDNFVKDENMKLLSNVIRIAHKLQLLELEDYLLVYFEDYLRRIDVERISEIFE